MKKQITLSLILALSWATIGVAQDQAEVFCFFSPNGGCERVIVDAIDHAESEVLIAAYSFSSKPIAHSLFRASRRGVPVYVLLDKSQPTAHYSMVDDLAAGGLSVAIDRREQIMHMKTIIIDRKMILTGSYNFTASAESRNAEILLLIKGEGTAQKAVANWETHFNHSQPVLQFAKRRCKNGYCPMVPTEPPSPTKFRRHRKW